MTKISQDCVRACRVSFPMFPSVDRLSKVSQSLLHWWRHSPTTHLYQNHRRLVGGICCNRWRRSPTGRLWPTTELRWVHVTGGKRPNSLEYQICTAPEPFDTLVTGLSPRAVCSGYISMHRRTHHQSDVTRIMCVVQGHSVVSHHFVFISHIEYSVGSSPWCSAQCCPNVQCLKCYTSAHWILHIYKGDHSVLIIQQFASTTDVLKDSKIVH